jgi:hypothetical protein
MCEASELKKELSIIKISRAHVKGGGLPNTQLETLFSIAWVSVPTPLFVLAAIYTRVCLLYEKGFRLLFLSAIEFEVNLQTYTKNR